jgi:hypothetical protein
MENNDKIKMEIPFFQCPNDIFDIEKEELSVNEKIVYIYLCRCCNQGSDAFPSFPTIGKKTSTSAKTAQRAVEKLIEKKLIIKINRKKVDKKSKKISNDSNLYEVIDSSKMDFKRHKIKATAEKPTSNQVIPMDSMGYGQRDHRGMVRETIGVWSERPDINNNIINNNYINNKQYNQNEEDVNTKNKKNNVVVKNQNKKIDSKEKKNTENIVNTVDQETIKKVKQRFESITEKKTNTKTIKMLIENKGLELINKYLDNADKFNLKQKDSPFGFMRDAILGEYNIPQAKNKTNNVYQREKSEADKYYDDIDADSLETNPKEIKL